MEEVAAQAAVDDVVGPMLTADPASEFIAGGVPGRIDTERRQIDLLLEAASDVNERLLKIPRRADGCLRRWREQTNQRLGQAVPTREDAAIVPKDAIHSGAAGDPVAPVAANDVVILTIAEQDVVSFFAVN